MGAQWSPCTRLRRSVVDPSPSAAEVLLYTRSQCCLCDQAKQQLRDLQEQSRFQYREVDIDRDPELREIARRMLAARG